MNFFWLVFATILSPLPTWIVLFQLVVQATHAVKLQDTFLGSLLPSQLQREESSVVRWPLAPISLALGGVSSRDVSVFAINSPGNLIAVSVRSAVRIYDMQTLQMKHILKGHVGHVGHISWHPTLEHVLVTSDRNALSSSAVRIWDLTRIDYSLEHPMDQIAKAAAEIALERMSDDVAGFSLPSDDAEMMRLAEGFSLSLVTLAVQRDVERGAALRGSIPTFHGQGFDPTGRYVTFVSDHNNAVLYDIVHQQQLTTLKGHSDAIMWSGMSPNGTLVATSSWDTTVRLWDVPTGDLRHVLTESTGQNWGAAFSPDGRYIAAGGGDRHVRVWDVDSGLLTHTFGGFNGWARLIAFSPAPSMDGKGPFLAAAGEDSNGGRVWLYNLATGQTEQSWGMNPATSSRGPFYREIGDIAFSSDGSKLGFKAPCSTLVVIDLLSNQRQEFASDDEHMALTASGTLAFSPDSQMVWSLDTDNVLRGWDLV